MSKTIGEVVLEAASKKKEEEQIEVFRSHIRKYEGVDVSLMDALRILFDKRYKFSLPEGTPPHKNEDLPDGLGDTNLRKEMRRMYLFLENSTQNQGISQEKRESLYISILEALGKSDKELFLHMKDQSLTGLSAQTVNKVFPNLIPIEKVEEKPLEEESTPEKPKKKGSSRKKKTSSK